MTLIASRGRTSAPDYGTVRVSDGRAGGHRRKRHVPFVVRSRASSPANPVHGAVRQHEPGNRHLAAGDSFGDAR
jgi:hypothetical protein